MLATIDEALEILHRTGPEADRKFKRSCVTVPPGAHSPEQPGWVRTGTRAGSPLRARRPW